MFPPTPTPVLMESSGLWGEPGPRQGGAMSQSLKPHLKPRDVEIAQGNSMDGPAGVEPDCPVQGRWRGECGVCGLCWCWVAGCACCEQGGGGSGGRGAWMWRGHRHRPLCWGSVGPAHWCSGHCQREWGPSPSPRGRGTAHPPSVVEAQVNFRVFLSRKGSQVLPA